MQKDERNGWREVIDTMAMAKMEVIKETGIAAIQSIEYLSSLNSWFTTEDEDEEEEGEEDSGQHVVIQSTSRTAAGAWI